MKKAIVRWKMQPARRVIGYTDKGKEILQTTEPWHCAWTYSGLTRILNVPLGYVWDGASIPRIGQSIIGLSPSGIMDGPTLPHDAPYRAEGGRKPEAWAGCVLTNENGNRVLVDRDEVDAVLAGAMKYAFLIDGKFNGSEKRKCAAVWAIVRVCGGPHWGGPCPTQTTKG